mmetsp:Transcript_29984/g.64806  ORF Transcript_29984/g.64806 Transcript_29984/m.64806 type:complete len:240 (-) Transcript_29984:463-1182(-)
MCQALRHLQGTPHLRTGSKRPTSQSSMHSATCPSPLRNRSVGSGTELDFLDSNSVAAPVAKSTNASNQCGSRCHRRVRETLVPRPGHGSLVSLEWALGLELKVLQGRQAGCRAHRGGDGLGSIDAVATTNWCLACDQESPSTALLPIPEGESDHGLGCRFRLVFQMGLAWSLLVVPLVYPWAPLVGQAEGVALEALGGKTRGANMARGPDLYGGSNRGHGWSMELVLGSQWGQDRIPHD